MKTFSELTKEQQEKAVIKETNCLLQSILEGAIVFDDKENKDDLQARIDAACHKAEDMHTPWFASEYVMDTCGEEIKSMAIASAEEALYSEKSEYVIGGVA